MIFGKIMNKYYLKYGAMLLLGLITLVAVDWLQLKIPHIYQMVVNGINYNQVAVDGELLPFDMVFLMEHVCMPLMGIILLMVLGRFLWRVCFFGSSIMLEAQLRGRMFDHARFLSREYYQVNKVGNLMSLFTNDLDTFQECYSWGLMEFCDAVFLGALAISKMWRMDPLLTGLALIPMAFLMASSIIVGNHMTKKWDARQEAFSNLSDFAQESFSGIAVIKAFVKEGKELWAFKKLSKENEEANIAFTKASVLFRILVMTFVECVICIILGYGGYLVYKGDFDAGQLLDGVSMGDLCEQFLAYVLDLASGKLHAHSEALDRHDLAIFKDGVTL